jgi:hypothetical protein
LPIRLRARLGEHRGRRAARQADDRVGRRHRSTSSLLSSARSALLTLDAQALVGLLALGEASRIISDH